MQEIKHIPAIVPKATRTPFYLSISFLAVVAALVAGFFFYNSLVEYNITDEKVKIAEKRSEIDAISRDRNVIIAKIEQSNTVRPSIDLRGIVRDFYEAASKANVRLKGFSINNDVISTSLTSTVPDGIVHPDAAGTIIKMMRTYAAGDGGRFSLEPITTINGDPKSRTTSVVFKVISNPIQ